MTIPAPSTTPDPACFPARTWTTDGLTPATGARVVSMPSWEFFEQQSPAYRASVLPPDVAARVVVEAASWFGRERYAGACGTIIGMRTFGASAPPRDLDRRFGRKPAHVVRAARAQLGGRAYAEPGVDAAGELPSRPRE